MSDLDALIDHCRKNPEAAADELQRLHQMLGRLWRTQDDMPILPRDVVWVIGEGELSGRPVPQRVSRHVWLDGVERFKGSGLVRPCLIYSDRDAAAWGAYDQQQQGADA